MEISEDCFGVNFMFEYEYKIDIQIAIGVIDAYIKQLEVNGNTEDVPYLLTERQQLEDFLYKARN